MARASYGAAVRSVRTLFRLGAAGGLTDRQLLERFLSRHDGCEEAFEVLVARHGPMVLSVCRHVVGNPHDADDAFQATFIVLVRRAGSIRNLDALGSWLHGVALRVAFRVKAGAARRRAHEERCEPRALGVAGASDQDELRKSLHEEIERLPAKYRNPIVLCDLEGQTHAEAAEHLCWPIGTVSGRLSRGRELLRSRIVRRGVTLSTGVVAASLFEKPAAAAVSRRLVGATIRVAQEALAWRLAAGVGPTPAMALARGVLRAGRLYQLKVAASIMLGAGLVVGVAESSTAWRPLARAGRQADDGRNPSPTPSARDLAPSTPAERPLFPTGHTDEITSIAFSPDGKTLASGSRDTTVKMWDTATRREKGTLRGHAAPILSLAFSPDGETLASADEDKAIKLWNVATGREVLSMTWPADRACDLAVRPVPGHAGEGTAGS